MSGLRESKREQTIQALEGALLYALRNREFDEVPVEELIGGARVSKQTFYNYFPGKEALLRYMVDERARRWRRSMEDHESWPGDAAARLWYLYVILGKKIKRDKQLWRTVAMSRRLTWSEPMRAAEDNVRDIIAAGQKRGELNGKFPAAALAWQLNVTQMAVCTDWTLNRKRAYSLINRQREALDIFLAPLRIK